MPVFVPALAKWFRTHQGIANRATLISLGLSPATIKALVGSGELIVEHEGVYRSAAWPVDVSSRCAAFCAADDRVVVCCGGLRRRQFDVPALYDVGRLLCRRGRDGASQFAQVLTSRPTWRRPVDSHPELDLLNELARRGVHLATQVAVTLLDGQVIHPDLGDPTCAFYIEVDDHEWHGGRLASTYDAQRDRQVRLIGGRVERVSTDEIASMSPLLIAQLVAAYHQHRSLAVRGA